MIPKKPIPLSFISDGTWLALCDHIKTVPLGKSAGHDHRSRYAQRRDSFIDRAIAEKIARDTHAQPKQ
jgi:hypothetical protein